MAGLLYLRHAYRLSDEAGDARWVENPYYQQLTGETFFQNPLPIDPSSLTRWRGRIGEEGVEWLLPQTIRAGQKSGVIDEDSAKRVGGRYHRDGEEHRLSDPCCPSLSKTSRTARSRTSGEKLFVVLLMMLHLAQELGPPANPERFRYATASSGAVRLRQTATERWQEMQVVNKMGSLSL